MPDISEGLSTGGQPSVDQMLADKVERERPRDALAEDATATVADLKRRMLAPEGIRAGLEEVRDLAPGELSYSEYVNSPEAAQAVADEMEREAALEFKREHDRWM